MNGVALSLADWTQEEERRMEPSALKEWLDAYATLREKCPQGHASGGVHELTDEELTAALSYASCELVMVHKGHEGWRRVRSALYRGLHLFSSRPATEAEIAEKLAGSPKLAAEGI